MQGKGLGDAGRAVIALDLHRRPIGHAKAIFRHIKGICNHYSPAQSRAGRNRIAVFSEEMYIRASMRADLEHDLDNAVVRGEMPDSLLDTYHAERHPIAARVLRNTLAQIALLRRPDDERTKALRDTMSELLSMDEPRKGFAAMMTGLDIHYDLGAGHPLLGRRMPDLDVVTENGPLRVFTLLHDARPVLLNLGEPGDFDIAPRASRVKVINAKHVGEWALPALGAITAPTAVLIRPDGYVAWVGEHARLGLADALTMWFGAPAATPAPSGNRSRMSSANRRPS